MDLRGLSEPFAADDIEWRVARQWPVGASAECSVLAYITNRAIMNRLDDVCGPENWMNTQQQIKELRPGHFTIQVGISIKIGDDWITKYDVAEPTGIEPAKGGFSGAMKRAGSQWGIGRYLYSLDEEYPNTSSQKKAGWEKAKYDKGGQTIYYWWEVPKLPSWALPRDVESEIDKPVTVDEIKKLKSKWRLRFAPTERDQTILWESWKKFVFQVSGPFPLQDADKWTQHTAKGVYSLINSTTNPSGPSADVPFGR